MDLPIPMNTPIDHARHNKQACEYLNDKAIYPDWVTTTAFYCAMHYSYSIIFPLTHEGNEFNNIEQYFNTSVDLSVELSVGQNASIEKY